ncbi:MAG: hypothetical protein A2402_01880 [Candidatus Staskawiczbacteria bacterium RIFOXYC1_FULL_37_43]|uniref:Zinc-binding domain-containing protein n=1 Tax=Candidatus Nomurabacteria bacterium RIFOXYA1_FULL_35_17 TaxID=1801798 RepID=A0A1F6YHN4_9BACT|nr:MAG: hypothetical protein A2192_01365 [Candidatus Nomurabacteria bacterium RIFOXYA1_FULL_35_17]OGZ63517.1 MAG: hypothetical protein A2813_00235 [Candidatus Staskawiczbacteria bacterium RIFCSPHIGHO2_01_FULL_37_17]OGZ71377.1 MAG: hypothetical protein A2891_02220 [Candidatus Staskawiczbacteria bacterium RIFCSPLOWO2_01_FULL_37_19]OGZ77013.1 MAG: hypothetical protein A2280_01770 [Candidatus Staskawiczbacteria bacterium RIFOXYA12_FULL_37_10]OGZ80770.1 MAG: hypothetical protein A2353_00830 [Candida
MESQTKQCQNCKKDFVIEPDDFAFYEKIRVPPPTFCPECRLQRRLSFRNERILYKRACDLCGKEVISIYHSEGKNVMYCQHCWWSDKWDPLAYGQGYDFQKPFFEQYQKLSKRVPRVSLINANSVNSEYTHLAADNKDCYMLFESSNNERCNHSYWMQISKDCLDCAFVNNSELCYELFVAYNCYKLFFSKECRDCTDSFFLQDCVGCSNCYGCVGLRQKQYHIFNKPYSKEDYFKILEEKKKQIKEGDVENFKKEFKDFALKQINKYAYIQKSARSTGNYLLNTKNCNNCFHGDDAENCKYGYHVWRNSKDNMDVSTAGRDAELVYETINTGISAYNIKFGIQNWNGNSDLTYCEACSGSSNLFGCISLHGKSYCILNKQCTKEEYQKLLPQIIEHMKKTGEYGEFFSSKLSLFAYNETVANDHFPLSKEEALKQGYLWKNQEEKNVNIGGDIMACAHEGKCQYHCTVGFKIIQAERDFYDKMGLPIPTLCPNCRHYERLTQRNPLKLWHRKCMKPGCNNEFETSYAPDRPEIVYCESCYAREVA